MAVPLPAAGGAQEEEHALKALNRVHVRGFRSLRDITLEPGRITVLIGPNGAGKSNLLSFLRFVPQLDAGSLRSTVALEGGATPLLYRGPKVTTSIQFDLEFEADGYMAVYQAELGRTAEDQLAFLSEGVRTRGTDGNWIRTVDLGVGHLESKLGKKQPKKTKNAVHTVRGWLRHMSFFHFHDTSRSSPLRSPARALEFRGLLPDGRNLAAYLLALQQSEKPDHMAAWRLFHGLVRRIAPFIKELTPTPVNADPETFRFDDPEVALDRVAIRLDWVDEADTRFGVSQLSDGTLRAIALFAALTQPGNALPNFICIDEPELGLHPAALALLAELVRMASQRCQVLLATQSPALLDHFDPTEVVVAEQVDGATRLRRLDPEALNIWLEEYSLSQLFDMNVLGGRP